MGNSANANYEGLRSTAFELKEDAEELLLEECGGSEENISDDWREVMTKIVDLENALTDLRNKHAGDYDPTPYCAGCGAMNSKDCHCGPRAEND